MSSKKKNWIVFCLSIIIFVLAIFIGNDVFAGSFLEGWKGDIFLGYSKTSGNTEKASGNLSAQAAKKVNKSTVSAKANLSYSETDNNMDGQKWDLLGKYSFDFGKDDRLFNFYQVLADHDYFADIDYRVTPSFGIGYHIYTDPDWIWDVDAGLGYRITRHRENTAADNESLTALAHTFMKKKMFDNTFISQDISVYPGLESNAGVILRSETALINPLNEKISLELKYIVDYDSEPAAGKKTTDTQFVAGLKYEF
ncbi:MAG: DUF481 domain-containing protein [Candidatus Omnitrophica bacterium]|nr:DUF481 domain-containing protein [Candidatus Omnitrophota bacterium]